MFLYVAFSFRDTEDRCKCQLFLESHHLFSFWSESATVVSETAVDFQVFSSDETGV